MHRELDNVPVPGHRAQTLVLQISYSLLRHIDKSCIQWDSLSNEHWFMFHYCCTYLLFTCHYGNSHCFTNCHTPTFTWVLFLCACLHKSTRMFVCCCWFQCKTNCQRIVWRWVSWISVWLNIWTGNKWRKINHWPSIVSYELLSKLIMGMVQNCNMSVR